jgi:hypothetical protein
MQLVPYRHPRNVLEGSFYVVPTLVMAWAFTRNDAIPPLVCLISGVAWQLVIRRDLADRLMRISIWIAVIVVAAAVGQLVLGTPLESDPSPGGVTAILATLSGLVVAELTLRNRDLKQAQRAAADLTVTPEEGVPARP